MHATTTADPAKPYRVLVCDDQVDVLEALRLLIKGQGWRAVVVDSPGALMQKIRGDVFDLILVDLNYTRDTTSGARRSVPADARRFARTRPRTDG